MICGRSIDMGKVSIKDKLYKDALITIDKLYESDQLTAGESIEELNDLKTQIDLRINLLRDMDKEKDNG